MTITASVPRNDYVGNGATTVFPYTFKIFTSSEIEIQLDGVVQTLGFTVSGVGASGGGNVTFTTAPANAVKILLLGKTARSQSTDWVENDPLTAQTIEDAVDRLTRDIQELDEALGRTLGFRKSSLQSSKVLDDLVANKYLQVKSDASGIQMVDVVQLLGNISSISGLNTNRIPYGINTLTLTTSAALLFDGTNFIVGNISLTTADVLNFAGSGASIRVAGAVDLTFYTNGSERARITSGGILLFGTTQAAGAVGGSFVIGNNRPIRGVSAGGTNTINILSFNTADQVVLGGEANDILWGKALVALGGGAAPTFGTIGGSGPAAAAQSHWLRFIDSTGVVRFMGVWT